MIAQRVIYLFTLPSTGLQRVRYFRNKINALIISAIGTII